MNFRQNLLGDVSAWSGAACKETLEDLEFRDNQLKEVRVNLVCLLRPQALQGTEKAGGLSNGSATIVHPLYVFHFLTSLLASSKQTLPAPAGTPQIPSLSGFSKLRRLEFSYNEVCLVPCQTCLNLDT